MMTLRGVCVLMLDVVLLHVKIVAFIASDIYNWIWREEKSISGEIILITGSGRNLGRELAVQLARKGAKIVLLDINTSDNEETAYLVEKAGGEAFTFTCDVSDYKSVANTANKIRKSVGSPTYVFSNAGVYYHKGFLDHSPDEILKLVDVNLLGNMWISREFIGPMLKTNNGHLICISSVLGFIGRANVVPYCASKWGVKGLTEALAEEVRMERRFGVTITAVHPFLISNVDDVKINVRMPGLFTILDVDEAASRIIKGVLRKEEEIFLPEKLKPLMIMSKILPRKLRRAAADFMEC